MAYFASLGLPTLWYNMPNVDLNERVKRRYHMNISMLVKHPER